MTKKIYWKRITIESFTGVTTFMYPDWRSHWDGFDLANALYDLDYDGFPATYEPAGISYIDDPLNAAVYYYKMEA